MSLTNNQSFASKMQELIDEHREVLSTEFVRLSMEQCQKEFNRKPTEMVVVKIYFDKYEAIQEGCLGCCDVHVCVHTKWNNVAQIPTRLYAHINEYFKDPLSHHGFHEIRGHLQENCGYNEWCDVDADFDFIFDSNSQLSCWKSHDTQMSIRAIIPV